MHPLAAAHADADALCVKSGEIRQLPAQERLRALPGNAQVQYERHLLRIRQRCRADRRRLGLASLGEDPPCSQLPRLDALPENVAIGGAWLREVRQRLPYAVLFAKTSVGRPEGDTVAVKMTWCMGPSPASFQPRCSVKCPSSDG